MNGGDQHAGIGSGDVVYVGRHLLNRRRSAHSRLCAIGRMSSGGRDIRDVETAIVVLIVDKGLRRR